MSKLPQKQVPPLNTSAPAFPLPEDHSIHHLAFDYSVQANIISSVKTGKLLSANAACCELLGYTMDEFLTKKESDIFDVKDANFKKLMRERTAVGGSTLEGSAYKKTGKSFRCLITSAVFKDEDGIQKSITTIVDQTEQILKQTQIDTLKADVVAKDIIQATEKHNIIAGKQQLAAERKIAFMNQRQKKDKIKYSATIAKSVSGALKKSELILARNNEWIKNIAKTSYDVMWDWNILSGEMYVGDSLEEVFGYKVLNNTIQFSDCLRILLPGEKEAVVQKIKKAIDSKHKHWKDSFKIERSDGSIATVTTRASILRNEKGKALHLIGSIHDISKLWEIEQQLRTQILLAEGQTETLQLLSKLSFDGIWDFNIVTNAFFLSDTFAEVFGISKEDKDDLKKVWRQLVHPDDFTEVKSRILKALRSPDTLWEYTGRLVYPGGTIAQVFCRANIIRDKSGKALRITGAVHDLSKEYILEERLEKEIKLKELQILDAMADAREAERSNIGQELHDNVNQLLGASRLYLDMAKRGGEESENYLSRSSEYTLTAIDEIRKLSKGLTTDTVKSIGLKDAVRNIANDIMETNTVRINFSIKHFIENASGTRFHLNVFRIIQEQLNNIIKHAKATRVSINLEQNAKFITLSIADNGVGFDVIKNRTGIGFNNILSRANTYGGKLELNSHPGERMYSQD